MFEDLACIEPILIKRGHSLSSTQLYLSQPLPRIEDFDWLIVLGGPMAVEDENQYPWLKTEKIFIRKVINASKPVFGICLGAQIIAHVMGAKVYKNAYREIGWYPITCSPEANDTVFRDILTDKLEVFHWHEDMFEIPQGAVHLASSQACPNQGFIFDNHIIGIQFHLECTLDSARALINNCRDALDASPFVQSEAQILSDKSKFDRVNDVLYLLIEKFEK
jgi:GMP synthase (glutamine-hydrolysing)